MRALVHRRIYLVLLTLLGGCMVTTVGLSNVVWPLLLANWLFEGRWREKWQMARESRLLLAIAVLFLMHVLGLLWTSDMKPGLHIVERMLPFMAVPLVVLTTPSPEGNTRRFILNFYGFTVFVVTIIGFVRWLTIPDLPHREIVTYISHIRFSLNICMVIFLLAFYGRRSAGSDSQRHFPFFIFHFSIFNLLLILWFLFFLLLLQSYTAFVILAAASLVVILRHRRQWQWIACWAVAASLVGLMLFLGCRSYYCLIPHASEPLKERSAGGRPYEHQQDGFIENGNYVNNYLCRAELINEWPKRSAVPLDGLTASGHPVESCLIRYLNALGLPKDSVGVAALTDAQVDEIARGIANPVYAHGSPFKRMLFVTLFEIENYRCYRAVTGFTMLQRIELWRCAWRVIQKHPWMGTGTGDLHNEMHTEFVAMDSPMLQNELFPHNEYLTLIALFGLPGFLIIVFFFLRALLRPRQLILHSSLSVLYLLTILLSFLTENTLDSLAGILFCTWFLAFHHSESPSPTNYPSAN